MQRNAPPSAGASVRSPALTLVRTLAVALAGGALFNVIHAPLPWMLGPLIACALANMGGAQLRLPAAGRNYGQWVIGTVLGLYFTPTVLRQVIGQAPWIALGVLWAIGLGLAFAWSLRRFAGISRDTAFFACASRLWCWWCQWPIGCWICMAATRTRSVPARSICVVCRCWSSAHSQQAGSFAGATGPTPGCSVRSR
jgi:membrane AbrB-like protein